MIKSLRILVTCAAGILLCSCGKEAAAPEIRPSTDLLEFEAKGGEKKVTFPDGDWCIESVRMGELETNVSGRIYDADGKQTGTSWLKLDGLGRLEEGNDGYGMTIRRDDERSLRIIMDEHCYDEDVKRIIRLQTGDIFKDIVVTQGKTDGFTMMKMEFKKKEGEGDALTTELEYRHIYTTPKEETVQMGIFLGTPRETRFECSAKGSFGWVDPLNLKVRIPEDLQGETVVMGTKEMKYGSVKGFFRLPELEALRHEVHYQRGRTEVSIYMEFRIRTLSYTATLVNKKTGKGRTYEGKWIEKTPTGKYNLTTQFYGM